MTQVRLTGPAAQVFMAAMVAMVVAIEVLFVLIGLTSDELGTGERWGLIGGGGTVMIAVGGS